MVEATATVNAFKNHIAKSHRHLIRPSTLNHLNLNTSRSSSPCLELLWTKPPPAFPVTTHQAPRLEAPTRRFAFGTLWIEHRSFAKSSTRRAAEAAEPQGASL